MGFLVAISSSWSQLSPFFWSNYNDLTRPISHNLVVRSVREMGLRKFQGNLGGWNLGGWNPRWWNFQGFSPVVHLTRSSWMSDARVESGESCRGPGLLKSPQIFCSVWRFLASFTQMLGGWFHINSMFFIPKFGGNDPIWLYDIFLKWGWFQQKLKLLVCLSVWGGPKPY